MSIGLGMNISVALWGSIQGTLTNQSDLVAVLAGKEPSLGNPSTNGYILSSTSAGTRSWIVPPTSAVWGSITGTLSTQSDLNTALGLKAPIASPSFTGTITLGTLGYSDTNVLESLQSSVNSYNQLVLQNTNANSISSTDLVVANNNSTSTMYYGDFGMNSSGFTGSPIFNQPNYVYLTSTSTDLAIGTTTSNAIHFVVNNNTTDAMTINSTGTTNIVTLTVNGSSLGTGAYAAIANYLTTASATSTYQPLNEGLTSLSGLAYVSASFVKLTGANTYTLDTNAYLTTANAASTYAPLTSPSLTTPTLGVATATTINKVTITAPATSAILTLAQGSSLITSGAYPITITATGTANLQIGTGGTLGTNAYTSTSYQPLATNLTSIGALANSTGYLYNNGSGTFSYTAAGGMTWPSGGSGVPNYTGSSNWGTSYGISTSATVNAITQRDSNANITYVNNIYGYSSIATSGSTTTLTVASNYYQFFTGTLTQTITLPVTSTLVVGFPYIIANASTGSLTVNASDASLVTVIGTGGIAFLNCINTAITTNAAWECDYIGFISASGKILKANNSITLAGTDGTTMTFPSTSKTIAANDGSNMSLASQAVGDLILGASGSFTRLAAVTAGSPLISNGVATNPAYASYFFSGTASQTYTFPTTSKTLASNDGANWTISGQAIGDIAVASSTTAYGRLAAVAIGSLLASNGTGTVPTYVSTIPSSILGNSTVYIGTTGIALNRASAILTLAGITLTTPTIGVATATTINNVTITQPVSSATLTIANTGSLITSGAFAIQFTAGAASTMTVPSSTSAVLNYYTSAPGSSNLLAYSGAVSGLISYISAPSVLSGLQQTTNGSAPAWVTATGTGAPVNAVSPTFTGTTTGVTWQQMPGSPTRASATQFTCSGSLATLTNYATKGMIVKWTESATVRCAMIYSSSYSAPTTTINIVGDAMASIDANSLMYSPYDALQFAKQFVVAGTIGTTGTDVANDYYAMEPSRVLALDMWVGTAGTTNSTSITMTNGTGAVNLFGTVSLASTITYSSTPTNGNGSSYYSLALGDRISLNVTAVQTTPAIDLYALLYVFPTRLLSLP